MESVVEAPAEAAPLGAVAPEAVPEEPQQEAYPVEKVVEKKPPKPAEPDPILENAKAYAAKALDKEAPSDPKGYYDIFKKFDTDGSGAVDNEELRAMLDSLGMNLSDADLAKMVKQADEDGSGEIELQEFVYIIEKSAAQGATGKDGASFAQIIQRKLNSKPCTWSQTKHAPAVKFDGDMAYVEGTDKPAVALLEPWMPGIGDKKLTKGNIILEATVAQDAHVWIGLVGKNFNSPDVGESDHWEQEFDDIKNTKKNLVTAARSKDGKVVVNAVESNAVKMRVYGSEWHPGKGPQGNAGNRFSIEFTQGSQEAVLTILNGTAETSRIEVDKLKPEMCFAVCFSASSGKSSVKLIGSSCEAVGKKFRRGSKDMWDDDNVMGVDTVAKGGVGMEELNGS